MMVVFLAAALLVLSGLEYLYGRLWAKGLSLTILFSENAVYAGEETLLTEELSNRSRLARTELEAAFRVPKGIVFAEAENTVISDYLYKRDIFSLRPMEKVRRTYRLQCPVRGRYPVSQTVVRGWSFFHTKAREIQCPVSEELLVYPAWTDVSAIEAMCVSLTGMVPAGRSLYEDPFSFAGIRDYRPSDPMKQINWKASARNQSWVVNTFESVQSEEVLILLDVSDERIVREDALLEAAVSAAASLARRLIKRGAMVGLAVNTREPFILECARGSGQLARIERFLTEDFAAGGQVPMAGLYETAAEGAAAAVCVLISAEEPERLLGALCPRREGILATPVYEGGGILLQVRRFREGARRETGSGPAAFGRKRIET